MGIIELVVISTSLAMDAFSASICKGLCQKKVKIKAAIIMGAYFGIFQAIMPIIGYYLGSLFSDKISFIDHYIAFFILTFIGISMIKEAKEEQHKNGNINFKEMIGLSIATSMDALIVGVTFSFLKVKLIISILIIGIITFILTALGYYIGNLLGKKYQKKSQIIGGIVLIIMGLKILIEHLF